MIADDHSVHMTDLWGNNVLTNSNACIQCINSYYLELNSTHERSYERMAYLAAEALVKMQSDLALIEYSKILTEFPKDLFSLKKAQVLCFYMGKCDESVRLASQVLPWNNDEAYMHGMLAFSLLETQRFDEAERAARKALMIRSDDKWAQHALCHVLQYRCLFQDAIQFMEKQSESWNDCCIFMYSHNWWHLAVSYLDWGGSHSINKVIDIYDNHLWPCKSQVLDSSVQGLLSALGLLLRLQVKGFTESVKERIYQLTQNIQDDSVWHKEKLLDLLMIWSWAYIGGETYRNRLRELQERLSNQIENKGLRMFMKVAKGLNEYGKGNFEKAFNAMGSEIQLDELKVIGASDEQLDIFEELWCLLALHTGHLEEVYSVLKKRTITFPGSPSTWDLMAEFHRQRGSSDEWKKAQMKAFNIKQGYHRFMSC
ncbi:hypothetical protein KP509_26G012400 [Ceratopteris richardii]|uniref:Tetratricopeptide repeat protein 38 n=1 Tax=Ceratopteris richardii TaxID=49495 RepID=A0A8T2RKG5_CERRI|nr:hypothetical protein KP509_26G012400 [Ceratopteris richardii]